jgi:hypothetical protein
VLPAESSELRGLVVVVVGVEELPLLDEVPDELLDEPLEDLPDELLPDELPDEPPDEPLDEPPDDLPEDEELPEEPDDELPPFLASRIGRIAARSWLASVTVLIAALKLSIVGRCAALAEWLTKARLARATAAGRRRNWVMGFS